MIRRIILLTEVDHHWTKWYLDDLSKEGFEATLLPPILKTITTHATSETVFLLMVYGTRDPNLKLIRQGTAQGATIVALCSEMGPANIIAVMRLGAKECFSPSSPTKLVTWIREQE